MDDEPRCTLLPGQVGTCYCTSREGCVSRPPDGDVCECGDPACVGCNLWDEPDDDAGYGDDWPPIVDAPDISLYDPAATQAVVQDTGGAR